MASRRPPTERTDAAARRLAQIAVGMAHEPAAPAPPAVLGEESEVPWWADHTRVAAPVHVPLAEPADPGLSGTGGQAPLVPVPGRHARRRRSSALRWPGERLPSLTPAHLAAVGLAVAIALAVTTWWVVRDDPGPPVAPVSAEPVAPVLAPSAGTSGLAADVSPANPVEGSTGAAAPGGQTVTVDVAGKVRRPGIVVLDRGARVTDALSAAGGARRGVDLTSLNLARVLVDGEQIVVGGDAGGAAVQAQGAPTGAGGAAGPGTAPVNLNLADQAALETLPGVGPVTAQAIIAWRAQRGGFTAIEELLEIDGIGEKTLARLSPHVTL